MWVDASNAYIATDYSNVGYTWTFAANGSTIFPTLTTQRGDNPAGTISGQTLLFGNSLQEAIISTPDGTVGNEYSQRLVINPGAGNNFGEGGDIYLWAGRGGDGSGSGGDIKIRGGQGGANTQGGVGGDGGYIRMNAGDAASTGGNPGFIEITGGSSNAQGGYVSVTGGVGATVGGDVKIYGGYGQATGGNVNIWGGGSGNGQSNEGHVNIETGGNTWTFAADGNLTLPNGAVIKDTALYAVAFGQDAGLTSQGQEAVAIGHYAGRTSQGPGGVAIGVVAGNVNQGIEAVAIGAGAGQTDQGIQSIAIGSNAGQTSQGNNSIIINAAQGALDQTVANTFTVAPVRNDVANIAEVVFYNTTSKEITYGNTISVAGNITGGNMITANVFAMTQGGNITEGAIPAYTSLTGNTIVLTPSGGTSADQQLVIYPTANPGADANHLHLTSGNLYNTELFLGDDFMYVKLANTGNIVINSNDLIGNSAQWTFGTDGNLTTPGASGNITGADYISANVYTSPGNVNVLVNGNTWTFGNLGNLILPNNGRIRSNNNEIVIATGNRANAYTESYQNPNLWEAYAEDDNTAANHAFAWISAELPTLETPQVFIKTQKGSDGTLHAWTFDADGNLTAPGNISTTGNITGAYFSGNGSQLTGVGAATVPGQTILPTIQTITIDSAAGLSGAGNGYANVIVANVTPVTEYGVIITAGTVNQKYVTGALGNIPGPEQILFNTGLGATLFTVYAYVTSNAGTYYSNAATGTSGICLLAGTQIALSDGSHKAIEDIVYTDKLLSWDFDRGCYAETTALWIKRSETGSQYNLLTFSDGTTLRTFDQHRIFNKQAGAFTYPMTAATPVGTVTMNEHGQEITLTHKQVIEDTIDYYNVITDHHMNLFSDTVLTSCRFNNIYPITDMKFVKDSRTSRTRSEFANIPDRFFHGLRLAEQTADVDAVEWYVDRLVATEVSTQAELAS
jgi:hypothetical protein